MNTQLFVVIIMSLTACIVCRAGSVLRLEKDFTYIYLTYTVYCTFTSSLLLFLLASPPYFPNFILVSVHLSVCPVIRQQQWHVAGLTYQSIATTAPQHGAQQQMLTDDG